MITKQADREFRIEGKVYRCASTAVFSDCMRYRYLLSRRWSFLKPAILFCLLNPSTADEMKNDPTIERCMRRAIAMEFGSVAIANVFAWRSTSPKALYTEADPVGPANLRSIVRAAQDAAMVVCGWGQHGLLHSMGAEVRQHLYAACPGKVYALVVNKDGTPKHPLYVSYAIRPSLWLPDLA